MISDDSDTVASRSSQESRLFIARSGLDLVRRAGDASLIVFGVLLFMANGWIAQRRYRYQQEFGELIDSMPSWVGEAFTWVFAAGALFVIWLLVSAILRRHPRWDVVGRIALSVVVSIGFALIASRLFNGVWPDVLPEFNSGATSSTFLRGIRGRIFEHFP